ncbi:MAG: hypothetical protein ACREE1_09565 [Stellaceae bacterium]
MVPEWPSGGWQFRKATHWQSGITMPNITHAAPAAFPLSAHPDPAATAPLADDLIRGAVAIGEFIGETPRRVFYLAERKLIPCGKQGATLIGSKRALREHYARLTGAVAAE